MQISITQADLESAIKLYVQQSGLTQEVETIEFTTSRKGGFQVGADITLAGISLGDKSPSVPTPRAVTATENVPEAKAPEEKTDVEPTLKAVEEVESTETESEPLFG